jgi:DNA ligase (NAD+)
VLKVALSNPGKVQDKVAELRGWSPETAKAFVQGAAKFQKWLAITGLTPIYAKAKKAPAKTQKLSGVNVTWTSYRNKDEEATVVENGGEVVSFGSKTTHLLYRPGGKESTKLDKARAKGIPVLTWDQFVKKMKL